MSIKEIEFPSITFCSQGNNDAISNASVTKLFYDFVEITSNEIKRVDYLSDKNIATFLYAGK